MIWLRWYIILSICYRTLKRRWTWLKNLPDDKAYRSLTLSWFKNSPLLEIIQQAQKMGFQILTTDHGTINVKNPSKVGR
jgi:hypothetical protein